MPDLKKLRKTSPGAEKDGNMIQLSNHVFYRQEEADGKRTGEGLVASGRWYPGLLVDKRFYPGLHQENFFIPGITAWKRFIPGLSTRRGFFPGIITSQGFQPGIIAMGVFVPGIVQGRNFVPGILNPHGFLPGCFTTDGQFLPGRFTNSVFEAGVLDSCSFIPVDRDGVSPQEAHNLTREGYGLARMRRYEPVGGLPICGTVVGIMGDKPAMVPCGLITTQGVILGGLWDKQNLPTLDRTSELGTLGIETDDGDSLPGLDNKIEEIEEMLDKLSDGLYSPLEVEQSGINLQDALEQLGQGSSELIDKLNKEQDEYWSSVFEGNSYGMISGSGNSNDKHTWTWEEFGEHVGGGVVSGGLGGGLKGALVGGLIAAIIYAAAYVYHEFTDTKPQPGGTSAPDEDGGDGNDFAIIPKHPPIGFTIPKDTLIKIERDSVGIGHGKVTITRTDTGVLAVVNYEEMAKAASTSSDNRINLGLNPITGNAIMVTPLDSNPYAVIGKALYKMYANPVVNPRY